MIEVKAKPEGRQFSSNRSIIVVMILVLLALLGWYGYRVFRADQAASLSNEAGVPITHNTLEEKYGVRVNLLAVTAASGMVDLRLKILDGDKASQLLEDRSNFPALRINEKLTLHTSEETASQNNDFSNDNNLYILYPNAGSAVKPGDPITIMFGDIALEPVIAK